MGRLKRKTLQCKWMIKKVRGEQQHQHPSSLSLVSSPVTQTNTSLRLATQCVARRGVRDDAQWSDP